MICGGKSIHKSVLILSTHVWYQITYIEGMEVLVGLDGIRTKNLASVEDGSQRLSPRVVYEG